MIGFEEIREKALSCGFTAAAPLNIDTICLRKEARDACAQDKCHSYGRNWACPPACGTLEECDAKIRRYSRGILLQTTGEVDTMDYEAFIDLMQKHADSGKAFAEYAREALPGCLVLSAGGCARCKKCTYPDEPCRFPESLTYPMEGLGMIVSDVCKANDLPYYYGKGTLTYTGCVLFD